MLNKLREKYREQGRQEMLMKIMDKFRDLHDDYYSQGDQKAQDLVIDLVAYIQDDYEVLENNDKSV
jgi:hypothetical protein